MLKYVRHAPMRHNFFINQPEFGNLNQNVMKKVKSVPEGLHTVTPYLIVDGADKFIDFTKNAFGAELTFIHRSPEDDSVTHATIKIGDSVIMIGDTMEGMSAVSGMLYLYVDDADALFNRAVKAKGKVERELRDEFYGDRAGAIKDQWGNTWWIATHVEDVGKEELEKRAKKQSKEAVAH
jgi:PhnB protein